MNVGFQVLLALVLLGYFTLLERKLLGYGQLRKGPNKGVVLGLVQPLLDGFKLFMKGFVGVYWGGSGSFYVMPGLGLVIVLFLWGAVYGMVGVWHLAGVLYVVMFLSALVSLLFFMSGWVSGCGYGGVGALRALAQALTYEGVMVFMLMSVMALNFSSSFIEGSFMLGIKMVVMAMLVVSVVMESSRTPVDFVEGESELVSGLATEFGGLSFTFLFLIEYGVMSFYALVVALVWSGMGGISVGVVMSSLALMVLLNWLRLSLPRSRYDLVMEWGWKVAMGLVFFVLVFISSAVSFFFGAGEGLVDVEGGG
uniref:NADH-ubiquinone oxidoreductase chain 1 n=1 Tax=Longicollum sp. (in: thorny-headed worms) TaxID=3073164 RepID=A0AA49K494_9BILA|nr:NADH dehydrogenase subunit 1 [Longicollum sp. (in: thorny-headed worms)]